MSFQRAHNYQYATPSPSQTYQQNHHGSPASLSTWGTLSTNAPRPKIVDSPSIHSFGVDSPPHPAHPRPLQPSNTVSPWSNSQYEVQYAQSRSSVSSCSQSGFTTGSLPRSGPAVITPNIAIIPSLNIHSGPQRLVLDLSRAPSLTPSTHNYHPDMSSSAFHPSMTYAHITIQGPIKWSFRIHAPTALTVYDVLSQIYHYLQGSDEHKEAVSSRMKPHPMKVGEYRDQHLQRGSYGGGVKRLDLLGPRHFIAGLEPVAGDNAWNVYLSTGAC